MRKAIAWLCFVIMLSASIPGIALGICEELTFVQRSMNATRISYTCDPKQGTVGPYTDLVVIGALSGAIAKPEKGYVFKNWTDADGNVVCTDAIFVPTVDTDQQMTMEYTAHFEAK